MNRKSILNLCISLACCNIFSYSTAYIYAQNNINKYPSTISVSLPLYELKNNHFFQMLDTAIYYTENHCGYGITEQPLLYIFSFFKHKTELSISVESIQTCNFYLYKDKLKGCFYYKDIVFGLVDDIAVVDTFFIDKKEKKEICIDSSSFTRIFTRTSGSFLDSFYSFYIYPNDKISFSMIQYCNDVNYVYHRIRKGETLSTIAEKYRLSESVILKLNHLERGNFPSKGKIRVIK